MVKSLFELVTQDFNRKENSGVSISTFLYSRVSKWRFLS